MTRRVQELRTALPQAIRLHYAMKANPMPGVVRHMATLVDGIDVASVGEMHVALQNGGAAGSISFAGPGKTQAELEQAAAAGIVVNLESEREMRALAEIARRTGARPRVAVRVNPDFELKASGMKMAGGAKQFGVDAERVPAMLGELANLPLEFRGFHIFAGSQNLRPASIAEAQRQSVELAIRLSRSAPAPVSTLNIGGGFGIPYFPGEERLDLRPISQELQELLVRVERELPQAELVLELGRYLVGEAGVYVCRVIERKISRGQVFLVTDGGLHHHLAASGNFGQVIRKNYPVVVGNKVRGTARETCVGGRTSVHAARSARGSHGDGSGRSRRSDRRAAEWRVWTHGESYCLSESPGAGRSRAVAPLPVRARDSPSRDVDPNTVGAPPARAACPVHAARGDCATRGPADRDCVAAGRMMES